MGELLNNTNNMQNDNVLSTFPPWLRQSLEELCLRSKIGMLPVDVSGITLGNRSNNYFTDEEGLSDYHFILRVPYAGKKLRWEVIFDPDDFHFAPDFDFNDEEFLSYPDSGTISENLPSWKNWDLKNPKCLAQLLNEFLALYQKHQIEKLHLENIYSKYAEEYKTLIGEKGIDADCVQVCVEGNTITFLISIKVDCSSLPEYIPPTLFRGNNLVDHYYLNQLDDFCHLKITIPKLDGTRSNYSLQLSTRMEQILGPIKFNDVKKDSSLIEIVTAVSRIIENKIQHIVNHHRLKKIYISTLAAQCERSIIEYDVLTFNKAVFTYNVDDYYCLVTVNIGARFPQEKPSVVLTSVYCPDTKPCGKIIDKYPYSSDLKAEINVKRLLEFLHDVVLDFKVHKH